MTQAGVNVRAAGAIAMMAASIALIPSTPWRLGLCCALAAGPFALWILAAPRRWLHVFLAAALLLPPLPFALGNSGPHIAILFAAIGLWAGVLRAPEWAIRMDGMAAALLAMFFAMLASVGPALLHAGVAIGTASFARVALFGIAVYVFFAVRDGPAGLDRGEATLRVLFFAAAASALFACADFYFQFPAPAGFGAQFLWLSSGVFRRAQGLFYEASTLGNLCAFFLLTIAAAIARPRAERLVAAPWLIAAAMPFAGALILSYSRASLLNLAVSLTALACLRRGQWLVKAALPVCATAGALAVTLPAFASAYWTRLLNSFEYFADSPNAVLSGRLDQWRLLVDSLLAHPWLALAGAGYKTLPYAEGSGVIADNTYLSILAETGVAGFLALIALNVLILKTAYRAARCPEPLRSYCGTCVFCFWCGQAVQMASADLLTYWRIMPVYFCFLALTDRK